MAQKTGNHAGLTTAQIKAKKAKKAVAPKFQTPKPSAAPKPAASKAKAKAQSHSNNSQSPSPSPSPSSSPSAKSQGFANKGEERVGKKKYKNLGQSGLQDPTNTGQYSAEEVKAEFRNKKPGQKVNEGEDSILDHFRAQQAAGATFNKRAQDFLKGYGMTFDTGGTTPEPTPTPTPTPSPTPTPTPTTYPITYPTSPGTQVINPSPSPSPSPSPGTGTPYPGGGNTDVDVTNTQTQTVNQDNDQISSIIGDNNTVTQNQDNSIDQLGGNNATTVNGGTAGSSEQANSLKDKYVASIVNPFDYGGNLDADITNDQEQNINQDNDQTSSIVGDNNKVWQTQDNSIRQYGGDNRSFVYNGSGGYGDTPVSAATMGGFYDVDDSPAAQAGFVDQYSTMNKDNQKRFAGMGMSTAGMFSGFDARSFDPAMLQTRIDQSTQRSYDQATIKDNDVFGDRDLYRGLLSGYNFGKPPKEIEYDSDDDD